MCERSQCASPVKPSLLVHQRAIIYWERKKIDIYRSKHGGKKAIWIWGLSTRLLIKVQMPFIQSVGAERFLPLQYWYNKQQIETAIVTLSSIIIEWNSNSRKKNFCLRAIADRVDLLHSWHFFSSICYCYVWLFGFRLSNDIFGWLLCLLVLVFSLVCWPMLAQQHWSMPFCSLFAIALVYNFIECLDISFAFHLHLHISSGAVVDYDAIINFLLFVCVLMFSRYWFILSIE